MLKQLTAATLCAVALAGATLPAQAGRGHHRHHHHHHHHGKHFLRFHVVPVYVAPSCGYYYAKWQYTGSHHWKKKYYICKGWW